MAEVIGGGGGYLSDEILWIVELVMEVIAKGKTLLVIRSCGEPWLVACCSDMAHKKKLKKKFVYACVFVQFFLKILVDYVHEGHI